MRRKLATAWWLVAVIVALVVSACGGSSSNDKTTAEQAGGQRERPQEGHDGQLLDHAQRPAAAGRHGEDGQAVRATRPASRSTCEVVGWDVQLDRIRNAAVSGEGPDVTQAGTTQVPFFAALGGFQDLSDRVDDIGGKAAYAPGVWQTTQLAGHGRHLRRAVVHRGAGHLLPQGRPRRRPGIDPATAFTDWRRLPGRRCRRSRTRCRRSAASRSRRSACPARRRSTSSTT